VREIRLHSSEGGATLKPWFLPLSIKSPSGTKTESDGSLPPKTRVRVRLGNEGEARDGEALLAM
jgi:hypothetical protein